MKISVFGLGYVRFLTSVCFTSQGCRFIIVDIYPENRNDWCCGKCSGIAGFIQGGR